MHLFIINPIAGGKKGRFEDTKLEIEQCVQSLDSPYEIYVTKAPRDATEKVIEAAQTEEVLYVYACGGDGTLNECVNGAVNRDNVVVTHYPCGTGNDFIKVFGKENMHKFRDLQLLIAGEARNLDVIDCDGWYGINICSVGIDARIGSDVHKYSSIPIIGGATGYVTSLLVNVIKGVGRRFKITSEQYSVDEEITLMCACNGRFYGGGFNPVPDALPDDGVIEFLIIKNVSRLQVAQIVKKYANGRYKELNELITHVRGKSMEVEGDDEFVVNIDGEIMRTKKVTFKIVAGGVKFLLPKGMGANLTSS